MSHSHGLCKARRFLADELKYVKAEVKFRLDNLEMSIAASGAEPSRPVDEMRGALMQMMESRIAMNHRRFTMTSVLSLVVTLPLLWFGISKQ